MHSTRLSICSGNPDQPSFKLKLFEKYLELGTYPELCGMINIYLVRQFFEATLLKCDENNVFFFESTQNKKGSPFAMLFVSLIF